MFQLARELPRPVIVTTTAHLGLWQTGLADIHITTEMPGPLEELEHGLQGVILITGGNDGERTRPIHPDLLNWLQQFCGYHAIPLLIEADGSREKPLKAWAEHEPPIPSFVELVVQVVGLRGVARPLIDQYVHRAESFARLSGLGYSLTRQLVADGTLPSRVIGTRRWIIREPAVVWLQEQVA